jgi:malate dehydrogenase (oxaloacetate-decarboxylating)(NADP+)
MDWDKYEEELRPIGNDNKMVRLITNRAKIDPKKSSLQKPIIWMYAAQIVLEKVSASPFMGNMEIIELKELGFEAEVEIIDTKF